MQRSILIPAVIATYLLLSSAAFAENEVVEVLKYPAFTEPELKRIPFVASLQANSNQVHVALHNPFRDKVIAGVVLEIAFKQGPDEKPTVLNLFIRLSCNPLQSEYGAENLFNAHEAREAKAIITLKEVHYYPEETAKTE